MHGGGLAGGTYADNGAGDRMGRGDGDTEVRDQKQRYCTAGLGTEALHGMQPGNSRSHRTHDAPATNQRAQSHGGLAAQDDPKRDVKSLTQQALRVEQYSDDAHRLLRIIATMPQR